MSLSSLGKRLEECRDRLSEVALKRLLGEMLFRIHNEGRATNGGQIGNYKNASYRKFRQKLGRQTGYKDLEVFGNLRRALQVGTSGERNVIGFINNFFKKIADAQETYAGKRIYRPTQDELQAARDAFVEEYRECLKPAS